MVICFIRREIAMEDNSDRPITIEDIRKIAAELKKAALIPPYRIPGTNIIVVDGNAEKSTDCNTSWIDQTVTITGKELYEKCEGRIEKLAKERPGDPVFWHFYGIDILGELLNAIFNEEEGENHECKES
jgi:hypothetical protein